MTAGMSAFRRGKRFDSDCLVSSALIGNDRCEALSLPAPFKPPHFHLPVAQLSFVLVLGRGVQFIAQVRGFGSGGQSFGRGDWAQSF